MKYMKDFTTDSFFRLNHDDGEEAYLFEHIEIFSNGNRFRVQTMNENGCWGGNGEDAEFTIYGDDLSRAKVVAEYKARYQV